MALTRVQISAQIRAELNVTQTELPNALLYDYLNLVQVEVASMLGPIVEPILRKRQAIAAYATATKKTEDATLGYTESTKTLVNFLGLGVNTYADDEIVFWGTVDSVIRCYKDIVDSNTATDVIVKGYSDVGGNGTLMNAIIFATPTEIDVGDTGYTLPDDCLKPLYLSDLTDPTTEDRIDIIQVGDSEQPATNTYWDAEIGGFVQAGNTLRPVKGGSATFPAQAVLTYISRPRPFDDDTDELAASERRLTEEYFGILRGGILKLAANHLLRKEEAAFAADDMQQRILAIQTSWGMAREVQTEELSTRSPGR